MINEITHNQLEEILSFVVKESIGIVSKENPCGEFIPRVGERIKNKYGDYNFSDELICRINNAVFWYITLGDKALIPSDGIGRWHMTEKAKNINDNEIKETAKNIFKKYDVYLKSNFEKAGYKII